MSPAIEQEALPRFFFPRWPLQTGTGDLQTLWLASQTLEGAKIFLGCVETSSFLLLTLLRPPCELGGGGLSSEDPPGDQPVLGLLVNSFQLPPSGSLRDLPEPLSLFLPQEELSAWMTEVQRQRGSLGEHVSKLMNNKTRIAVSRGGNVPRLDTERSPLVPSAAHPGLFSSLWASREVHSNRASLEEEE